MAPKSLVLVPLFCLVMLARHSIQFEMPSGIHSMFGGNFKCYHSLYYVKKYDDDKLKALEKHISNVWHDKITNIRKSVQCSRDVGCETYRCKDARGDDIFVINGCAKQKIKEKSTKCTLDVELDQFCSLKADRLAAPSCSLCYKEECNLKTIELEKKNDPNDDFCYHTVRYINKNTLPRDLLSFLKKNLGITPKIRETVSCKNGRAGCQVFRCSDNADNDQFRVTACATSDSDCTNGLNQFCTRGLLPQCQRCLDKKCSQRSTELQGSEAADNPTMYDGPNPGLRCLLKRICALLDAVKQKKARWKTVKLSRRFAPRWPKKPKKSKKSKSKSKMSLMCKNPEALDTRMQDVADPSFNLYADLSEELEDSPANEMNRMFMDEYLVAIGAVIDVN